MDLQQAQQIILNQKGFINWETLMQNNSIQFHLDCMEEVFDLLELEITNYWESEIIAQKNEFMGIIREIETKNKEQEQKIQILSDEILKNTIEIGFLKYEIKNTSRIKDELKNENEFLRLSLKELKNLKK